MPPGEEQTKKMSEISAVTQKMSVQMASLIHEIKFGTHQAHIRHGVSALSIRFFYFAEDEI